MSGSPNSESLEERVVQRAKAGDQQALAGLFSLHRPRLLRLVEFRMERRLLGRIDPDDVLQEVWLNSVARFENLRDWNGSVFIWFRLIVTQTLIDLHRRHLEIQKRDASREQVTPSGWSTASTSMSLAEHLLGNLTSPSQAFLKAELASQLETALKELSDIDQEVLALRHFEELSNIETAEVLGLTEQAASIRYVRALSRLKSVLVKLPEFKELVDSNFRQ